MNSKCVIAFFNIPSGRFRWWDEFPIAIRQQLDERGVDFYSFYRSAGASARHSESEKSVDPGGDDIGSPGSAEWLMTNVWPILERYDRAILHTHGHFPSARFRKLINRHGRTRWVTTVYSASRQHTSPVRRTFHRLLREYNFLPEWFVGVSAAATREIENSFGKPRVMTIHSGIKLTNDSMQRFASRVDLPHRMKFLFVNRLVEGKGVSLLIEAMTTLLQSDPDFHLTIVGDGPCRHQVEQFLQQVSAPNVTWVGHSTEVDRYYASHDVLLLPYTSPQGLPLVSLEARAYGLPAVYSALGGVLETRDKSNGIAMREATAESLLEAIGRMTSVENFAELVEGCYRGLEHFSLHRMVNDYCVLYQRLLGARSQ